MSYRFRALLLWMLSSLFQYFDSSIYIYQIAETVLLSNIIAGIEVKLSELILKEKSFTNEGNTEIKSK